MATVRGIVDGQSKGIILSTSGAVTILCGMPTNAMG